MPSPFRATAIAALFAALCAARALCAQPAAADDFGREFQALSALRASQPPKELPRMSDAALDWSARRNAELHERALALLAAHPAEPRRWDVVMLLTAPPPFTRLVTVDGVTRTERDPEAYRAWRIRYTALVEELLAASDSSPSARARAYSHLLGDYARNWRTRLKTPEGQEVLRKAEALYAGMERELRHNPSLINGATALAELLDAADPARCQAFLRRLLAEYSGAGRPDTDIRAMAAGRLKLLLGQAHPVWLALQALDGQRFTSRDYEGKIVLLTLAPLTFPGVIDTLKHVTATYRDRGVEIIQVSTGRQHDLSAPPLAREALHAYGVQHGVTWRVVHDGSDHLGQTARSLGLHYLPAYILLSRDHRFVAETASPRELTRAIDIELALPASP